jgi:hypothetical protein
VKRVIRGWMTMTLMLLSACGGTGASSSQPIAPPPPSPPPNTVAGTWNLRVATPALGVSCVNPTLSLLKHDTTGITVGGALLLPPDTLILGTTTGCGTSSPFAKTTLTYVQGKSANGTLVLWLFPSANDAPQLRLDGMQSDATHMSGLLSDLTITPFVGGTIGTWSATK